MALFVRIAASLMLLATTSACGGVDRIGGVTCDVYGREQEREALRGETVTVRFPRDEAVVERAGVSVHLITGTEHGDTNGSLVVAIRDDQDRELSRGLYQFRAEARDQFGGGHGFTGLVIWRDPTTGAEIQYFCNTA